MNILDRSWTEQEIKNWANTSQVTKSGGYIIVQHYKDLMFHYFAQVNGKFWAYKMNSVVLHSMEPNG